MPENTTHPNEEPEQTCKKTTATIDSRPQVSVDLQRYAHFLEDADLTEKQRREFLKALWSIICSFVELGFHVHPIQQAAASKHLPEDNRLPVLSHAAVGTHTQNEQQKEQQGESR